MLGGHGNLGEIDGEIRGLLVPRQTGSAFENVALRQQ
jgi:hypothetical protein